MGLLDWFQKKKRPCAKESATHPVAKPGENSTGPSAEESVEHPAAPSPEALVKMALEKEPLSIYEEDGKTLTPAVEAAVFSILPGYNPQRKATNNLVENDPKITKANLQLADTDTLLLFFKFLTVKATEEENNAIVGIMQTCTLAILQKKLS